jgi:hypothetical protein
MRKKKETYSSPVYTKKAKTNNKSSRTKHSILHYHDSKIEEFKNDKKRKQLQSEISKLKVNDKTNDKTKISKLESELNKLKQEETEYLLSTSDILLKYLELEDLEKTYSQEGDNDIKHEKLLEIHSKKITLTNEYMQKVDPDYILSANHNEYNISKEDSICINCDVILCAENGFYVCYKCGYCVKGLEESSEPSYKELQDYMYKPQFTYQKETHLDDHLRRLQAKENKVISQEVLDMIILEANKQKITDLNMLTESTVKKFLKKLNLNDYYDNVIAIINKLNNRPPVVLTTEIENKIKIMFKQIQQPFIKHKPVIRKNFLSYSYILFQFFKILKLDEFTEYFPLLKSADKLRQQDEIFKKIVADMAEIDKSIDWVFYPTI